MNYKLAERLANLLNYSLDVFASPRGLKLKIKNMADYGFDPKFILSSIINIFVSFMEIKEFLEYIVRDERSFKIDNFLKVLALGEAGKIKLDFDTSEKWKQMVSLLQILYKELKSNEVFYYFI